LIGLYKEFVAYNLAADCAAAARAAPKTCV